LIGQVFTGLSDTTRKNATGRRQQVRRPNILHRVILYNSTSKTGESEVSPRWLFVVIDHFLYQKGSSESKDPEAAKKKWTGAGRQRRSTVAGTKRADSY
jgi:hypothetical protein